MVSYPEDWKSLQLKDIGYIQMCRRIFQDQTKKSGQIPFYKIGTFGGKADAYISRELFEQFRSMYPYPEKGDVLLSAAGTVGKTVVFDGRDSYFQDSNIVWLKVNENEVDKRFLYYFYKSFPWKALEGTTIGRLYNNIILDTNINLPIILEQQSIVLVLSDFDKHIENLIELIEKKKFIRDGVMENLVSGRNRIDGFDGEWEEKSLNELCYLITKQTGFDYSAEIKPSLVLKKQDGVLPFIQNKDFEKCRINYNTDFYIPKGVAEKYPQILLDEICLLISISGRIGNVAVFDNNHLAFAGGAVGIAKLIKPELAEWCMYFLLSEQGQKQIFKYEKVGAQHNLTIEDVRKLRIKIPSTKERESITSILNSIDVEIEVLESEKVKMIGIREGAMDDLLTGRVRLKI